MITGTINIHTSHLPKWARFFWYLRTKKVEISIPQSWEEIPTKRRWKVLKALMQGVGLSKDGARLIVLKAMVGLPRFVFNQIRHIDFTEKLLPYIDWIFDTSITDPFSPTIRVGATVWRIPIGEMRNVTVAHYFQVERQWARLSNGEDQSIYLWLSAFLREESTANRSYYEKNGMHRNVPNTSLEAIAEKFKKVKPEVAFYLMQYYGAQRVAIKKKYASLFDGSGKSSAAIDWDTIPARIAESGVFGSLHEVMTTPATTYLAWANAKAKETAKQEHKTLQDIIRAQHQKFLS